MARQPSPATVSKAEQLPAVPEALRAVPEAAWPGSRRAPRWLNEQLYGRFYLGTLQAGDRMPGVRQLARDLNVSPTTVHQLYGWLQSEGILEARERSGTFVRSVGRQLERGSREVALFRTIADALVKMGLAGVSPERMVDLFGVAAGVSRREDIAFGLLAVPETAELLARELAWRLTARPRLVHLSPAPRNRGEVRRTLGHDPAVSCLIATSSNSALAFELADAFDLYVIFVQLAPVTAALFEPPAEGTRYVVSRDRETADGFRELIPLLMPPPLAARFAFADLGDADALRRFAREAAEVWATEPAVARTKELFPRATPVRVVRFAITPAMANDVLFHYLFAGPRGSRHPQDARASVDDRAAGPRRG